MKNTLLLFVILASMPMSAQFAPPAGQIGTTAIHKDSSVIVAWATGIEVERGLIHIANPSVAHEGSNYATFGEPENALGQASGNAMDVVSLGDGGMATLSFANPIYNGDGPDFCVFENSFSDTYLELAFVEVSSDGQRFVRFPSISRTQTTTQIDGFGSLDATKIHNLAGKYRQGFGTPFDLEDLIDSSDIDLNHITHIRIIDVVGSIDPNYARYDSEGNSINDLFPTPFNSGGFDLDAVGVIHERNELIIDDNPFNSVSVYPNPFSEVFVIQYNIKIDQMLIYDFAGKLVFEQNEMIYGSEKINLNLEAGVYFMMLVSGSENYIIKLIKN